MDISLTVESVACSASRGMVVATIEDVKIKDIISEVGEEALLDEMDRDKIKKYLGLEEPTP